MLDFKQAEKEIKEHRSEVIEKLVEFSFTDVILFWSANEEIKSLQTENEQLKKDIQTHISTENKLKKSNQSLSKEITELHNSIESSNTQIAKMNSEIARLIDINSRNPL